MYRKKRRQFACPVLLIVRAILFFPGTEMDTGKGIGAAVLESGMDAMTAGNGGIAVGVKENIVLAKMSAISADGFFHGITSDVVYKKKYT